MSVTPEQLRDTQERVRKILAEQTGKNESEITDNAKIADQLGADSLTIAEIVLALEEEFSIEIPNESAEKIATVADVVHFVGEELSKKEKGGVNKAL